MPNSLSYLFMSLFVAFIFVIYICSLILSKKLLNSKKNTIVITSSFIILQLYFWNNDFNDFTKSIVFFDSYYKCEQWNVPLPKRTVLQGSSNHCSSFYRTYIKEDEFFTFYQTELAKQKLQGAISDFIAIGTSKGFVVYRDDELISITYKCLRNNYYQIKFSYQINQAT